MTTASGPEQPGVFRFDVAEAARRLRPEAVIAPQLHDGAVRPTDDDSYEAGAREALRQVRAHGPEGRLLALLVARDMGVRL